MGVLRILLALAVANSHHCYLDFRGMDGHVAVQAFFIISGFYIALILDEKYAGKLWTFYSNRFLRIYPPYFAALALMLLSLLLLDAHPCSTREAFFETFGASLRVWAVYAWTSLALVGQELLFVLGVDQLGAFHFEFADVDMEPAWHFSLVTQAWSLGLEVAFYLAAPFILRRGPRRIACFFAASLGLTLLLDRLGSDAAVIGERLLAGELYLFLAGALGYHLYLRLRDTALPAWLGPLWLGLIAAHVVFYETLQLPGRFPLLAGLVALGAPFVFRAFRDVAWDRRLGELSYPFYLTHFLVIGVFETHLDEPPEWLLFLCQVLLALGLYALLDRPLDRWRQRRASRPAVIRIPGRAVLPGPPLVPSPAAGELPPRTA